ncbi:MAG: FAD-dependent oxidoreductase [Alphaproteobacteria bacterium]|jgi:thioredoxin reductase (NADPH)|nr:FAD-dependent oxidoreductase [Alphaproteobacteria bacterium]
MRTTHDIIVVGGGVAGLTAALHARLAGCSVACFEGELHGGLVVNVGAVDGYPAVGPLSGVALTQHLVEAGLEHGVEMRFEAVTEITAEGESRVVTTDQGRYTAAQVILATGGRLKQLGVDGETALTGRGVSQCAFCDAGFFRDRDVVVVGGGDAALQEALHLAESCRTVTLVHRGNSLRARRHYVARAADHEAFRFRWESEVEAIAGAEAVEGVRLRSRASGEVEELACDGVFVFVGVTPNSGPAPDGIERDGEGAVLVDTGCKASLPGFLAIGAARAGYGGRLTQAVGDATTAAETAARRVLER